MLLLSEKPEPGPLYDMCRQTSKHANAKNPIAEGHRMERTALSNIDFSLDEGRLNRIDEKYRMRDKASLSWSNSWIGGFSGLC